MMRTEQSAADAAAEQADAQLAAARSEDGQLTDETAELPGVVSAAQVAATLAVAEQLRALRLGVTAAIEQAARKVAR